MKPSLLNVGRLPPSLEKQLAEAYTLTTLSNVSDPEAFLRERGAEFTALTSSAAIGVGRAVIEQLPNLRVISNFGVGLDKVDVAFAQQRGVAVGYTPDVLNDCVADVAFALLLDVARGASNADRFVRAGRWPAGPFPLGRKVSGARLGIVGMGRIGRTIARRATGFDMTVRYHTRRAVPEVELPHEPSLIELARWCDYLVLITAGGPSTHHLINDEVLTALGPDGFLINVARGSVVDEAALVRALQDKRIAGAGLDVFADEPHVPTELMALDNVVLLPHIASATRETRQAMADRVFDNLQAFFAGQPLLSAAHAA